MTDIIHIPRGPMMADVAGFALSDIERERLCSPAIGGVILFRRNYQSRSQLKALISDIKSLRNPALVVAVDHEGGRVQRFIHEFTRLPCMKILGDLWDHDGEADACSVAETVGWVLATELRSCGVDLSFTPVLDLDWDRCAVIGNRSFHHNPHIVTQLAISLQRGLLRGGMGSCGKHFPGHGYVAGDSHKLLPQDDRSLSELLLADIQPFADLIQSGMSAIMPAHVIYPQVDAQLPAGFSTFWLKDILRKQLHFQGVIFSDDLTMEGASIAGDIISRARQAFMAGCDIILVCNKPSWVDQLLADYSFNYSSLLSERWNMIQGHGQAEDYQIMMETPLFKEAQVTVAALAAIDSHDPGVRVGE